MADDSFMKKLFDREQHGTKQVFDWPFDGERTVTVTGTQIEASEHLFTLYDETGKRVDYDDAKEYGPEDELPVGWERAANIDLCLYGKVDDLSIPELQYPLRYRIGNELSIETDGVRFRWVKGDGTPRSPSQNHRIFDLTDALQEFSDVAGQQFVDTPLLDEDGLWWNPKAFDGITVQFGVTTLGEGQFAKDLAFPVGRAEGEVSAPTTSGETVEELAAAAADAEEFKQAVINSSLENKAELVTEVVTNAEAAYEKYSL